MNQSEWGTEEHLGPAVSATSLRRRILPGKVAGLRLKIIALFVTTSTALLTSSASAVAPERGELPFSKTLTTENCGFPVLFTFEGKVSFKNFFDDQGEVARIQIHRDEQAVATNLDNGKTATGRAQLNAFLDVDQGRETEIVFTGLPVHFNFPGQGAILMDAGKLVIDPAAGEITFVAGPHQAMLGDFSELCTALA